MMRLVLLFLIVVSPALADDGLRTYVNRWGEDCVASAELNREVCNPPVPEYVRGQEPPTAAQVKAAKPGWKRVDWVRVVGWGLMLGAAVADTETTVAALGRCPGCRERNPIFGERPGRARLYTTKIGIIAAVDVFANWGRNRMEEDYGPAEGKVFYFGLVALPTATQTIVAIENTKIKRTRD